MTEECERKIENFNFKNKTHFSIVFISTLFIAVTGLLLLRKLFSKSRKTSKFNKTKNKNEKARILIENRTHLYSKIELNTSEHPDDAVTIRIKADNLGLEVEEFKKIHNEAVLLHKEISCSENLVEVNKILNKRAEQMPEELDRVFQELLKLNKKFKRVEMNDSEFESQYNEILIKIYKLCDRYSKLELQYKMLIENIKKNKEEICNFDFEVFGYLNSKIEGFKMYLNFYERMDLK